jgi:hypothetical protein
VPAAIARFRPSPVRSRIRSRSKSAMAAKSVDNSRPCELDVSHSGSPSDRNAATLVALTPLGPPQSGMGRPLLAWRGHVPCGKHANSVGRQSALIALGIPEHSHTAPLNRFQCAIRSFFLLGACFTVKTMGAKL